VPEDIRTVYVGRGMNVGTGVTYRLNMKYWEERAQILSPPRLSAPWLHHVMALQVKRIEEVVRVPLGILLGVENTDRRHTTYS
jgi:hypothetical protein